MNNFEAMKEEICDFINQLSEEELYDFISDQEGNEYEFETVLTCQRCKERYGKCSENDKYEECVSRFQRYCNEDAE